MPRQPRILIYGAGAVGSLVGGILSNAGHDVTLLGRGDSIKTVHEHGLYVQIPSARFHVRPRTLLSTPSLKEESLQFDIVFLTMRSFAVPAALEDLGQISRATRDGRPYEASPLMKVGGVLISLQNGIGTEEVITQVLPDTPLVAGSLTLSAEIEEPGTVRSTSRSGGISLAPVSPNAPTADVVELFESTGIPVTTASNYRSMKWSKLLLNQMANGIPAILDWLPGQVYRNPDIFRVEQALLRETLRVIAAEGAQLISLPGFPVPLLRWALQMPPWIARRLLLSRVEGGRGDKPPSLLLDIQSGRDQTEAGWLYGSVAEVGEQLGIEAPINRRIYRVLEAITVNPYLRDAFRDNPNRLIRNVLHSINDGR